MKKIKIISVLLLLSAGITANAQQVSVLTGDPAIISGETKICLQYDYEDVAVGKFDKEEDYINKKVADYNSKKPGSGDSWLEKWKSDRKARFQPSFENKLNEMLKKAGVSILPEHTTANYTIILKTTFIEPGFNVYVTRQNASINAEAWIIETDKPDKVLCKILLKNMPGRTVGGDDYDSGTRISEAYEKAGKDLGSFLASKVYKKKK